MTKQFHLFIPITKVDEEKRLVYGLATAEQVDKSGEIFDYDSSLPFYKEWSGEIEKASGGKSLGNVREMHTNIAAGKLTEIHFNDELKQIEVCAKIVNESTWEKVLEGVLTGFSHGGEYIATWKDPNNKKITRYTAKPAELSVVDNPCLGAATFELLRADGAKEMRKFKTKETDMTNTSADGKPLKPKYEPVQKWEASDGKTFAKKEEWRLYELELEQKAVNANSPVLSALDDLRKAMDEKTPIEPGSDLDPMTLGKKDFSDDKRKKMAEEGKALPDGSFPIESTQDLKNAIHAYGRAANKDKAKEHIIARAKALGEEKMLPEGWGGAEDKDDNNAATKVAKLVKAIAASTKVKKGLSEVARAACIIQELNWLCNNLKCEEDYEGDDSMALDHLHSIMTELCTFLETLVEEECHELAEPHAVELMGAEDMEMAAKSSDLIKKHLKAEVYEKLQGELAKAVIKAGARHSAADKKHLAKAMEHLGEAVDHHEAGVKAHAQLGKAMGGMEKAHEEMGGHHDGMGKAYGMMSKAMGGMEGCMKDAAAGDLLKGDLTNLSAEGLAQLKKAVVDSEGKMKEHMDKMHKAMGEMKEHMGKAEDTHDAMEGHMDKAEKHHEKLGKAHEGMAAAHDALHHDLKAVGAPEGDDEQMDDEDEAKKAMAADLKKAQDDLAAANAELAKRTTERDDLKKTCDAVQATLPELTERLKKLEAQPLPPKGVLYDTAGGNVATLKKGHEAQTPETAPDEAVPGMTHGKSPEELRQIMGITFNH